MTLSLSRTYFLLTILYLCCLPGCGEKSYDLQLAVEAGEIYRVESDFKLENADIEISQGTDSTTGTQTLTSREVFEYDIYEAQNSQPNSMKISFLESWQKQNLQISGNEPEITDEISPLQARTLLCKKSGKYWKSELVGNNPTAEQTEVLNAFLDPWPADLAPDHSVSVGDSWVVTGDALARLAGGGLQNIDGELKAYFEQVIERNGTLCAVISVQLDLSGTQTTENNTRTVKISAEGLTYRSVSEKIDLESKLNGTMTTRISEEIPSEGLLIMISQGPFTFRETTTKTKY